MSSVLFSVWFRIQLIIEKCPGYYSASGPLFRVFFKMRPAVSGSGFSVLFKNVQGIIQRLVPYSGYYSKYDLQRLGQDSAYYKKKKKKKKKKRFRVLYSVWFSIQRIIKKCPGYYSASVSGFSVLLKKV